MVPVNYNIKLTTQAEAFQLLALTAQWKLTLPAEILQLKIL
jgi:hypothetical protein